MAGPVDLHPPCRLEGQHGRGGDRLSDEEPGPGRQELPDRQMIEMEKALDPHPPVSKTLGLLPGRVTYVVDPNGIVRKVFSSQFKPKKHIDEALAVISSTSPN